MERMEKSTIIYGKSTVTEYHTKLLERYEKMWTWMIKCEDMEYYEHEGKTYCLDSRMVGVGKPYQTRKTFFELNEQVDFEWKNNEEFRGSLQELTDRLERASEIEQKKLF